MPVFNFELLRTYSTNFEIEAENQDEAIKKFHQLKDEIYAKELEQCNIVDETIKGDKYARKCSHCDKGMNEGYVVGGGDEYYCTDECLHKVYTPKEWNEEMCIYENDDNYWTSWWDEDEEDYQYQIINNRLVDVENEFIDKLNNIL
jgi:hypothetical protein